MGWKTDILQVSTISNLTNFVSSATPATSTTKSMWLEIAIVAKPKKPIKLMLTLEQETQTTSDRILINRIIFTIN